MLKPSAFPVQSVYPVPIAIPAFADNYIWLLRQGSSALVVDPGDAAPVLAFLRREGLRLAAILVTHHHADHQGGIAELLAAARADGVEPAVFGPAAESITGLSEPLCGGETIPVEALALAFRVVAVPGHTRGHLAYYRAGQLFCGDTLFGAGCGRLFEGTASEMAASLAKLAALPGDTGVYCAHEYTVANLRFALAVEPENVCVQQRVAAVAALRAAGQASVPSSLALEKASNPFLRCGEPEVIDSVLRWCAQSATPLPERDDPVAVFAALRAWKNVF
ncbi:hydroxyacylglutathione hydrolase [Rhodocyclus tenuis]|uniref:Hydroxyacylglutathione hydrolase n=1 Tax=Rhodocyclus tenuis TaxID=1066 RepID=A0A840GBE5_RHOTE|nr:hydroxyacylglutathione hydrolase [Rhodocyclus tenuis]MBB4249166.1 hydroxyacylglutathione hydrolase [Rhodocyclus tenuis]